MIEKLDETIEEMCRYIQRKILYNEEDKTDIDLVASALAELVEARTNAHIVEESKGKENFVYSSSGKA